jgi:tRNA A-37 threonylcarbamoyl transferase component Bud32
MNLMLGISGCNLEIVEEGVIRKYSSSLNYNERLLFQVNKQKFFSNLILKNIDVPKIYGYYSNDLYFFDMEYIPGKNYDDYLMTCNFNDINFIIESFYQYFDFLINNHRIFNAKINILLKLETLETKSFYTKYIKFLKDYVNAEEVYIPKTFCHGDLTFSNIIFHPNRLYFIDFLDSYIDSFFCDLVKLKQDLYYYWNLKIQDKKSLRLLQIYNFIWDSILKKYNNYINIKEFDIIDSINYLRIEPYLTNDKQRDILNKIIKSSKLYEKFVNTDGWKVY